MDCKAIDYKSIPVQADIISGIIRLDVESNSCFRELDNFVRSDQGVAALVLRVVNSPLYSRGKQIATIPLAISVLGFNVVRSLAMLAFSRSFFSKTRNELFRTHLWQHSLLTALAGQTICQSLGQAGFKDEAFIAGLMHDTGKVLLFTHDTTRYLQVLAMVLEQGYSSAQAEREVFGCDHCEVGREAVRQWKLPEHFAEYMGTDLSVPDAAIAATPVRLSLAVANCLIESTGFGAQPKDELEARKAALLAFGVEESRFAPWLQEEFITKLMSHDTYQLCAHL